jgi:hypothetical protein
MMQGSDPSEKSHQRARQSLGSIVEETTANNSDRQRSATAANSNPKHRATMSNNSDRRGDRRKACERKAIVISCRQLLISGSQVRALVRPPKKSAAYARFPSDQPERKRLQVTTPRVTAEPLPLRFAFPRGRQGPSFDSSATPWSPRRVTRPQGQEFVMVAKDDFDGYEGHR